MEKVFPLKLAEALLKYNSDFESFGLFSKSNLCLIPVLPPLDTIFFRVSAIFFQLFYCRIRPPMQTAAAGQNTFKSGAHKFFSQGAILDCTLVAIPRTLVVKHLRNIRWQWEFAEMVWKSITTPPLGRDYQRERKSISMQFQAQFVSLNDKML